MEQFKIINKIGEGAYSTVYTVRRIEDNKIYALKKVKIKKLSKKEQANALNEVRILASVNSPYVIGYKESFIDEAEQTLNIIMEYADDGDLYQKIKLYLKNKTFFMEHDIWRIFIQITKGLNDLHEYNILHRDLKSANVFLFSDGTAKLGDLNVSKITTRGLGYTQTGTPYYASPEVWKDKPYNSKSDIWSLGCVFYELIMLNTPFKGKSMKDLYEKVKKGEYTPIPKYFSPKFQIVIDRILKIRPEERPSAGDILNMDEILDKIEEYDIFKNNKDYCDKKKLKRFFKTDYKINNRIHFFERTETGDITILSSKEENNNNNNNCNDNSNNNNNNSLKKNINMDDELIIKTIKRKMNNKQKIIRRGNNIINVNKSVELHEKINSNFMKKYEIFKIYKHNVSYFKEKLKQKKKIVLKTIKYPKKLIYLNKRLPEVRYDNSNDNISKENDKNILTKNDSKFFFPIHKILPKIHQNKIENKNEEAKNAIINNDNKNKYFIINTLHQKINKKNPFNNKGKIDIIIEK